MITIKEAHIHLTEVTVREIIKAIDKAKAETRFVGTPIPHCDMDAESSIRLNRERGKILVESPYTKEKFVIEVETIPNSQESLGYHLHEESLG